MTKPSTKDYWDNRYKQGYSAGSCSYGRLANFKAAVINDFIAQYEIKAIADLGYGDGYQTGLFDVEKYYGYEISSKAVERCSNIFASDSSKVFSLYEPQKNDFKLIPPVELSISLDVLYHIVEDDIYNAHMRDLFGLSNRFVIIYANNTDIQNNNKSYLRFRKFTNWVKDNLSEWTLSGFIPNQYPYDPEFGKTTSICDFYFFSKMEKLDKKYALYFTEKNKEQMDSSEDHVNELLDKARTEFQGGSPEKALKHLKNILEFDSTNFKVLNNMGLILVSIGHYDEAEEAFKAILGEDSKNIEARLNLAKIYFQQNRLNDLNAFYKELNSLKPSVPAIAENWKIIVENVPNLDSITDIFTIPHKNIFKNQLKKDNFEINKDKFANNHESNEIYHLLGEKLKIDPLDIQTLLDYGIICYNLSKYEESISTFKRILEINYNHNQARKCLCLALIEENRIKECKDNINILLNNNTYNDSLFSFVAKLYHTMGDNLEAQESIDEAIKNSPTNLLDEYTDLKATLCGLPKPSETATKKNGVVCCAPGMDSFIHTLIKDLSPYINMTSSITVDIDEHIKEMSIADIVWLEWGNELTKLICDYKKILLGKRVIIRIHSYEVINKLVANIDFRQVSDIVFVSKLIRDQFQLLDIPSSAKCRKHIIHNSIDIKKFKYVPRQKSMSNIAFVANISYKKDPMLLLHAFNFLHKLHPEVKLHIAGKFQDVRYDLAMNHFINETKLSDSIKFYGHISNINQWLEDKDYIICTSPLEGQGVGLLEAMSRGCRPLIVNFPGASDIYPSNYLWTTFDDLEERFLHGPEPKEASDFVAKYYSSYRELASWLKVLLENRLTAEIYDFN
jgi:glycosyltransferase involved in cell wall biosynthesis